MLTEQKKQHPSQKLKLGWSQFRAAVRARGKLGALLALSLVSICIMFISLINRQNKNLNPNLQRQRLNSESKLLEISQWKTEFVSCESSLIDTTSCTSLGTLPQMSFPAPNSIPSTAASFAKQGVEPNGAFLSHELTPEQIAFLNERDYVAVVLPRTVQNSIRLKVGNRTWSWFGFGSDAVFTLASSQLTSAGQLRLEFDYRDFPWFGPAELPIALVDIDSVADYSSLVQKQISSFNLSRQMEIGFPLLLAAMAIVLDHSRVFALLSLYSWARAVRSFVPFMVESGTPIHWGLELLVMLANAAAVIFIVKFALEISGLSKVISRLKSDHRKNLRRAKWLSSFICVAGFLLFWQLNPALAWVKADIVSDSIGAVLAIGVCGLGMFAKHRQSKKLHDEDIAQQDSELGISNLMFVFRLSLISLAFLFSLVANTEDLWSVSQNALRNALDWKHTALVPILITAALLDVGSIARKMLHFGRDMASKALLEKELQVGKEVQHRMLPLSRQKSLSWSWRSLYAPAQALAGDWFDIKELQFPCGKKLLAVCVADVTGHGVGSSLATSVICSHWNLWCAEFMLAPAPEGTEAREKKLLEAPQKIHRGLLALPQNEQCTAILALLDPYASELSVSTCGHPGAITWKGQELNYISSPGDRLGASDTQGSPWRAKTIPIEEGTQIFFYSDGILPPGGTVTSFANSIRRRLKKEEFSVSAVLWKQFRLNRKQYKVQRDIEDDMTLLSVEWKSRPSLVVTESADSADFASLPVSC